LTDICINGWHKAVDSALSGPIDELVLELFRFTGEDWWGRNALASASGQWRHQQYIVELIRHLLVLLVASIGRSCKKLFVLDLAALSGQHPLVH